MLFASISFVLAAVINKLVLATRLLSWERCSKKSILALFILVLRKLTWSCPSIFIASKMAMRFLKILSVFWFTIRRLPPKATA